MTIVDINHIGLFLYGLALRCTPLMKKNSRITIIVFEIVVFIALLYTFYVRIEFINRVGFESTNMLANSILGICALTLITFPFSLIFNLKKLKNKSSSEEFDANTLDTPEGLKNHNDLKFLKTMNLIHGIGLVLVGVYIVISILINYENEIAMTITISGVIAFLFALLGLAVIRGSRNDIKTGVQQKLK